MTGPTALAIVLLVVLACPPAAAQSVPSAPESWQRVIELSADQKVRLQVDPGSRTVKGRFVSADPESITVRSNEAQERFPREAVRQVKAVQKGREHFQMLGGVVVAAAGAIALATTIGQGRTLSAGSVPKEPGMAALLLPTITAGAGGVVAVLGTYRPVYDRPHP